MAIKAGVPVVPVACSGAHRVMEKRSLVIHPGEILVDFSSRLSLALYVRAARNEPGRHDAMAAGLPPDRSGRSGSQAPFSPVVF